MPTKERPHETIFHHMSDGTLLVHHRIATDTFDESGKLLHTDIGEPMPIVGQESPGLAKHMQDALAENESLRQGMEDAKNLHMLASAEQQSLRLQLKDQHERRFDEGRLSILNLMTEEEKQSIISRIKEVE